MLGLSWDGGQIHGGCLGCSGACPASPIKIESLEIRLCLGLANRWAREPQREATYYQIPETPPEHRETGPRGEEEREGQGCEMLWGSAGLTPEVSSDR